MVPDFKRCRRQASASSVKADLGSEDVTASGNEDPLQAEAV